MRTQERISKLMYIALTVLAVSCSETSPEITEVIPPVKESPSFKIGTYNMRYDGRSDVYSWSGIRKELAIDIIDTYQFDILGTQELHYHQLKDVLDGTSVRYQHVGVATGDGKPDGTESLDAILFRKERFDLLSTGDFWYSDTPDVPSISWGAAVKTHCTWAKFQDKQSKKEFYVFNSHFIFDHEVGQMKSANILIDKMNAIAKGFPIFCVGDFNADTSTPAIKTLMGNRRLLDSKTLTPNIVDSPKGGTFSGFEANKEAHWRIDLILVSSLIQVLKYEVIQDDLNRDAGTGVASDHLPVLIEARL